MAVSAKPEAPKPAPSDPLNDPKIRQFVQGGGSAASARKTEDGVKFTLPIPGKLHERVERHRDGMAVPTSRIAWVLQAIAEKLDRDGY